LAGFVYIYLADSRVFLLGISLVAIWVALGTNMIGMKIGKWTENVGAGATWVLGALRRQTSQRHLRLGDHTAGDPVLHRAYG
jgi:hypothetical protein